MADSTGIVKMPQEQAIDEVGRDLPALGGSGGKIYVSDVLEDLLKASAERHLARETCRAVVADLPGAVVEEALYYGGKCMGYPALWFVRQALRLDQRQLSDVAQACRASLFLSLTASIIDDWIDQDEPVTIAPVSLLYMLMVRGLGSSRQDLLPRDVVTEKLKEIIEQLLLVEQSAQLDRRRKLDICSSIAADSGIKIGNFHELIAAECCNHLSLDNNRTVAVRCLANDFGQWCALLDDIIDVAADIENGDWASLPAARLLSEVAKENVQEWGHDELAHPPHITAETRRQLVRIADRQLAELISRAGQAGLDALVEALEDARRRLPTHFAVLVPGPQQID